LQAPNSRILQDYQESPYVSVGYFRLNVDENPFYQAPEKNVLTIVCITIGCILIILLSIVITIKLRKNCLKRSIREDSANAPSFVDVVKEYETNN